MANSDPLKERYQDFIDQENWLGKELDAVIDRAVDEANMSKCQVAGVLMDIMLTQLGRPSVFQGDSDDNEVDQWRP